MGETICEKCGRKFKWKIRHKLFGSFESVYGCNVVETEKNKNSNQLIVIVRCNHCGHIQSSGQILDIK
jgi:hypothetical protein